MYLFRPPRPDFLSTLSPIEAAAFAGHGRHTAALRDTGAIVAMGATGGGEYGVVIFQAPDPAAAEAVYRADPAVRAGVVASELHPFVLTGQGRPRGPGLVSVALQTHRMEAMRDFYQEAFGFAFREVTAGGIACWFGEAEGLVLKLVPLRAEVDFEGYPTHQLGFTVDDPARVAAVALQHGGRAEADGSVRDPDGNTIELEGWPGAR